MSRIPAVFGLPGDWRSLHLDVAAKALAYAEASLAAAGVGAYGFYLQFVGSIPVWARIALLVLSPVAFIVSFVCGFLSASSLRLWRIVRASERNPIPWGYRPGTLDAPQLEDAVRICVASRGKLGDFGAALTFLHRIAMLTADEQVKLAKTTAVDPITLRGITLACGFACKAAEWLTYHGVAHTRDGFKGLIAELQPRMSDTDTTGMLFRELVWGAQEMLRLVDWEGPENAFSPLADGQ